MGSSSGITLRAARTSLLVRTRQGLRAIAPAAAPALPERFADRLPASVQHAWYSLVPYDRRHLIAVASELEAAGQPDHVVVAGLLHDIGKNGNVTVLDRVAVVLLGRLAPGLRERLAARHQPPATLDGLHLLLRHADIGADLLVAAGMPAEVVWLVRHHEREIDHPELNALRRADHRH